MNSEGFDLTTLLIGCGAIILLFSIGFYLQVRIIKVVKEEKAMAWDITITHSVVMTFHFGLIILLDTITYIFPTFKVHFGTWFCYCLLFIRLYNSSSIALHSLFISAYKYIFIVHNDSTRSFKQDKLKKILFWVYIIFPLLAALSYIIRPSKALALSAIHNCGLQKVSSTTNISIHEPIGTMPNQVFFCGVVDYNENDQFAYVTFIITRAFCFLQTIALTAVLLNILEIFFYVQIFRYMRR